MISGETKLKGIRQRFRSRERVKNGAPNSAASDKDKFKSFTENIVQKFNLRAKSCDRARDHRNTLNSLESQNYDGSDDTADDDNYGRRSRSSIAQRKVKKSDKRNKKDSKAIESKKTGFEYESVNDLRRPRRISQPTIDSNLCSYIQHSLISNENMKEERVKQVNTGKQYNKSVSPKTSDDDKFKTERSLTELRKKALKSVCKENKSIPNSEILPNKAKFPSLQNNAFNYANYNLHLNKENLKKLHNSERGNAHKNFPTNNVGSAYLNNIVHGTKTEKQYTNNEPDLLQSLRTASYESTKQLNFKHFDYQQASSTIDPIKSALETKSQHFLEPSCSKTNTGVKTAFETSVADLHSSNSKVGINDRILNKNVNNTNNFHANANKQKVREFQTAPSDVWVAKSNTTTPIIARKNCRYSVNDCDSLDELLESNKDYLWTMQRSKGQNFRHQRNSVNINYISTNQKQQNTVHPGVSSNILHNDDFLHNKPVTVANIPNSKNFVFARDYGPSYTAKITTKPVLFDQPVFVNQEIIPTSVSATEAGQLKGTLSTPFSPYHNTQKANVKTSIRSAEEFTGRIKGNDEISTPECTDCNKIEVSERVKKWENLMRKKSCEEKKLAENVSNAKKVNSIFGKSECVANNEIHSIFAENGNFKHKYKTRENIKSIDSSNVLQTKKFSVTDEETSSFDELSNTGETRGFLYPIALTGIENTLEKVEVHRETIVHKKSNNVFRNSNENSNNRNFLHSHTLFTPSQDVINLTKSAQYLDNKLGNPFNTNIESANSAKENESSFSAPNTLKPASIFKPFCKINESYRQNINTFTKPPTIFEHKFDDNDSTWKEIEKMTDFASSIVANSSQFNKSQKSFSSTPRKSLTTPQENLLPSPIVNESEGSAYTDKRKTRSSPMFMNNLKVSNCRTWNSRTNDYTRDRISSDNDAKVINTKNNFYSNTRNVNEDYSDMQITSSDTSRKSPKLIAQTQQRHYNKIPSHNRRNPVISGYDNVNSLGRDEEVHVSNVNSRKFVNIAPHGLEYELNAPLLRQKLMETGLVENGYELYSENGDHGKRTATPSMAVSFETSHESEQMTRAISDLQELAREIENKVNSLPGNTIKSDNFIEKSNKTTSCSVNNELNTTFTSLHLSDAIDKLKNSIFENKSSNDFRLLNISKDDRNSFNAETQYVTTHNGVNRPVPPKRRYKLIGRLHHSFNNDDIYDNYAEKTFDNRSKYNFIHEESAHNTNKFNELIRQIEEVQKHSDVDVNAPLSEQSDLANQRKQSLANPVTDDLASRRFKQIEQLKLKPETISPSFLSVSPVFSPTSLAVNALSPDKKTPDIVLDDLTHRKYNYSSRLVKSSLNLEDKQLVDDGDKNAKSNTILTVNPLKIASDAQNVLNSYNANYRNISKNYKLRSVETQTTNVLEDAILPPSNKPLQSSRSKFHKMTNRRHRRSLGHNVGKLIERFSSSEDESNITNSAPDLLNEALYRSSSVANRARDVSGNVSHSVTSTPLLKHKVIKPIEVADNNSKGIFGRRKTLPSEVRAPLKDRFESGLKIDPCTKNTQKITYRNKYSKKSRLERFERSKSFPELLATFENDPKRLGRLSLHCHLASIKQHDDDLEMFHSDPCEKYEYSRKKCQDTELSFQETVTSGSQSSSTSDSDI